MLPLWAMLGLCGVVLPLLPEELVYIDVGPEGGFLAAWIEDLEILNAPLELRRLKNEEELFVLSLFVFLLGGARAAAR